MKRIFVCIDGTQNASEIVPKGRWKRAWHRPRGLSASEAEVGRRPTNVLLLTRALGRHDSNGCSQVVHYVRGVGTDDSAGGAGRIFASAIGRGLSQIVQDAYVFLTNNYVLSDKVYVLGFSRGAAAARSLSGLTELIGVLPKSLMDQFPIVWDYYNTPLAERAAKLDVIRHEEPHLASIIYTGDGYRQEHEEECNNYDGNNPHPGPRPREEREPLRGNAEDSGYVAMPLHFVGVWDTVLAAHREGYHEQRLAWNVGCARQALAIHELRGDFTPQLWERKCPHQNVIQTWFPGSHSDIGGGNGNVKRSALTLRWMIGQLKAHSPEIQFDSTYCTIVGWADRNSRLEFEHRKAPWITKRWSARYMGGTWRGESLQFRSSFNDLNPALDHLAQEPEESRQKLSEATKRSLLLTPDQSEDNSWYI